MANFPRFSTSTSTSAFARGSTSGTFAKSNALNADNGGGSKSNLKKMAAKQFTNTTFFSFQSAIDKQFAYLFSDPMAKAAFWVAYTSRRIICDPECQIYLNKLLLNDPEVEFVSKEEAHRRRTTNSYSLCKCCAHYFPADPFSDTIGNQEAIEADNVLSCCMYIHKYTAHIKLDQILATAIKNRPSNFKFNKITAIPKDEDDKKPKYDSPHLVQLTWLVSKVLAYHALRTYKTNPNDNMKLRSLAPITGLSPLYAHRPFHTHINLTPLQFEKTFKNTFPTILESSNASLDIVSEIRAYNSVAETTFPDTSLCADVASLNSVNNAANTSVNNNQVFPAANQLPCGVLDDNDFFLSLGLKQYNQNYTHDNMGINVNNNSIDIATDNDAYNTPCTTLNNDSYTYMLPDTDQPDNTRSDVVITNTNSTNNTNNINNTNNMDIMDIMDITDNLAEEDTSGFITDSMDGFNQPNDFIDSNLDNNLFDYFGCNTFSHILSDEDFSDMWSKNHSLHNGDELFKQ